MNLHKLATSNENVFVAATAIAAFVHSTWALGVLFAGLPPAVDMPPEGIGAFAMQAFAWLYWFAPAALIAFALDVGQVATAAQIATGQRTRMKYATFVIFAFATYYLQWIYMAHHMPALELGAGVAYQRTAQGISNAAIWLIPAMLPASTLLYTFSHSGTQAPDAAQPVVNVQANAPALHEPETQDDDTQEVQALPASALEPAPSVADTPRKKRTGSGGNPTTGALEDCITRNADGTFTAACPECANTYTKPTQVKARMSLTAHMRKHAQT